MTIIIFLIVLAVLILVHEAGHFIAAKASGIRVDEFGLGFPPKLFGWKPKGGETTYTLNLIPFGGFVKIFGEDPDAASIDGPDSERSFVNKSKLTQVWVLVAGITFNILFAWLLISLTFMMGVMASASEEASVESPQLTILSILPDSPATEAGLKVGDAVLSLEGRAGVLHEGEALVAEVFQDVIKASEGAPVALTIKRGEERKGFTVMPKEGIVPDTYAVGVSIDTVGLIQLPLHRALWEGTKTTVTMTGAVAVGLGTFLFDTVRGAADFSQVTGPVGIVGMVGDAATLGLVNLMFFTAFISINLAVINLVPFPALDGGRILFVIIEAIKRSPIKPKVANTLNTVGFVLLLLLMLVVTYKDIVRLIVN